jgi:hypothetical protein
MNEMIRFILGVAVLFLGIPLGYLLAKYTPEELKPGKIWFENLIIISLIGGIIGFSLENNGIMFSFFFIAIVTSQSLIKEDLIEEKAKKKKKTKKNN